VESAWQHKKEIKNLLDYMNSLFPGIYDPVANPYTQNFSAIENEGFGH